MSWVQTVIAVASLLLLPFSIVLIRAHEKREARRNQARGREWLSQVRLKSEEAMTGWQPIETAPDNTDVLLTNGMLMAVGRVDALTMPNGRKVYLDLTCWPEPTHWMPLPDPPTT